MHLRRALILFALVLGLTALAASIAPPPREEKEVATAPAPPPEGGSVPGDPKTLPFRVGSTGKKPPVRKVAPDEHVIVEVVSEEPGEATLPKLGRLAYASETVPARFNLLAPAAGRYDVMFEPTGGEARRVGTIVSAG